MSENVLVRKEKPQKEKISPERIMFHCPFCGTKVALKEGAPPCGCYGDFDFWSMYKFYKYKIFRF